MVWGGWWVGDSEFIRAMFKRQIRVPGSQCMSVGQSPEEERPPAKPELWSGAASLPPSAELHAYEPTPGTRKRQQKAASQTTPELTRPGSLTLLLPAGSGRLPHTEHRVLTKSLGIELSWPLTTGWSDLPNKAQNQGLTSSSNQLQITFTVEQIQHYTVIP